MCSEYIDGNEMIYNSTLNDYEKVCKSCTIYILLLLIIMFVIIISIGSACFYFYWFKKKYYFSAIY